MELKINKQWMDVAALTNDQDEATRAVREVLARGLKCAVIAIEAVDTGRADPELLTIALPGGVK